MTPPEPHYLFTLADGVGVITLNRPARLNAMTWELATDLVELLRGLRARDEVRAIVLTGAGRAFCSGADAGFFTGAERPLPGLSDDPAAMPRYQRKTPAGPFAELTRAIVAVDKPVVAAISGAAVGAGLAYALACDRRVADPTAKFSVAMIRLGFSPDCGVSYFLPRVVGVPAALWMTETGRTIDAAEAKSIGLVDELVAEGGALDAALAYAKELAGGPSVAIDLGRRGVHRAQHTSLEEAYDYEAVACTMAASTRDAREGMNAFLARRKPRFGGR